MHSKAQTLYYWVILFHLAASAPVKKRSSSSCPPAGYSLKNGLYYKFLQNKASFGVQRGRCRDDGADLAVFKTRADYEAVTAFRAENNSPNMWVGIFNPGGSCVNTADCDGRLQWLDGETFRAMDFYGVIKADDGLNCLRYRGNGEVNDYYCSQQWHALCQIDCGSKCTFIILGSRSNSPLW